MNHSLDLRTRVIAYFDKGVSRHTIFRWLTRRRKEGIIAPKPASQTPKKCPDQNLINYIKFNNDSSLEELATKFKMTPLGI